MTIKLFVQRSVVLQFSFACFYERQGRGCTSQGPLHVDLTEVIMSSLKYIVNNLVISSGDCAVPDILGVSAVKGW